MKSEKIKKTDNLQTIISIVNFVPPNAQLLSFNNIWASAFENYSYPIVEETRLKVLKMCNEIVFNEVADYPRLKHFLEFNEEYFEADHEEPFYIYKEYMEWRDRLRRMAEVTTTYAIKKAKKQKYENDQMFKLGSNSDYFSITARGTINFMDFFKQAFSSCEADRIRICKICDRIFFATRTDKWTCSVKCGQVNRTRRKRKKEKKIGETKEISNERYLERQKFINRNFREQE